MFGNIIYTPTPESYCKYALLARCADLSIQTVVQYTPSGIGYVVVDNIGLRPGLDGALTSTAGTAVFCYHQSASIWATLPSAVEYSRVHGRRVVLFDYPGYGISEGSPWENSIVAALEDVVRTINLPSVHLVGDSVGAGVVLSYMAKRVRSESHRTWAWTHPPQKHLHPTQIESIRLVSPFTSLKSHLFGDSPLLSAVYQVCGDCFYQNDQNIYAVPESVPVFIFSLVSYYCADYVPVKHPDDGHRLSQLRGNTHYVACDYPSCNPNRFGYMCASKEDVAYPHSQYTGKMSEFG